MKGPSRSVTQLKISCTWEKIPTGWEESIIAPLHRGKGVALDRGNYRGFKFLDKAMTVLERLAANFIWQQVLVTCSFVSCLDMATLTPCPFYTSYKKFHAVKNKTKNQQKTKTKTKQCTWLRRYGRGIGSCTQMCHMVSPSKPWRRGVAGAPGAEHIWKYQKHSVLVATWMKNSVQKRSSTGRWRWGAEWWPWWWLGALDWNSFCVYELAHSTLLFIFVFTNNYCFSIEVAMYCYVRVEIRDN